MNDGHYPPPKQFGLLLHGILILALTGLSGWGIWNLTRAEVGPNFVIFLLDALLALVPVPLFVYRAYALMRADYILDRDSLEIRWGLRDEDIPLTDIEWLRPASDLTTPLRLPWLPIPGAVLGLRRHPDLGVVEFLAADPKNLLLVATSKRVYAISPTNAAKFAQTFARTIEMGSLMPAKSKSIYPSFIFSNAWENPLARFLWLIGLFMNIGLVVWVGLTIPTLNQISLGFAPSGAALSPSPASQLILLPIESAFLFLAGLFAGLYYYRWENHRILALILWASSALTSLLFLLAVLFIVSTPV
ncbi:MAG: PH domain-containing protein [Anaerolineales bacterium]|nr:PH domain-containing protein [Anaerolineales bacterium]